MPGRYKKALLKRATLTRAPVGNRHSNTDNNLWIPCPIEQLCWSGIRTLDICIEIPRPYPLNHDTPDCYDDKEEDDDDDVTFFDVYLNDLSSDLVISHRTESFNMLPRHSGAKNLIQNEIGEA